MPGNRAAGNSERSSAIGRPSPSRIRRTSCTGSSSASRSAAAAAGPAGRDRADSTRAPATIPCRRSCSENPARVVRSCSSLGAATTVPPCRPTVRVTRPRRASSASACRSVIRLTPNHLARSCSVGSRSPGVSAPVAICPASQSSICPCTVVPGSRTIRGGCREPVRGAVMRSGRPCGRLDPGSRQRRVVFGRRHDRREPLGPPDDQVVDRPDQHDEDHHGPQDRDSVEEGRA